MLSANFQASSIAVISSCTTRVNLPQTRDGRQLDYLTRQFVIKTELFHRFELNFKRSFRIKKKHTVYIYIYIYYIYIYIYIYIYTPVYKNIAISEIYITYMYKCQKKTKARWTQITPAPWCGHYMQFLFSICIYVFSGAHKKDTGAEKV